MAEEPGARHTAGALEFFNERLGRKAAAPEGSTDGGGRGVANAVGGIKLGGGADAGSAAELSRAPAAEIRSGTRATHWAGVLVGPGLYKSPEGKSAWGGLLELWGPTAGAGRWMAAEGKRPRRVSQKADSARFLVHPVCTGDLVAVCFCAGGLGPRERRGGDWINSPGRDPGFCTGPLAAVGAVLPQKGWVIERSCVPRQPSDPRAQARVCEACLVVRRPSSMTSFLFRQD